MFTAQDAAKLSEEGTEKMKAVGRNYAERLWEQLEKDIKAAASLGQRTIEYHCGLIGPVEEAGARQFLGELGFSVNREARAITITVSW